MEYATAIGAALAWAVSAPIVNRGVANLPPKLGSVGGVMVGLAISLVTGVLCLGLFATSGERPVFHHGPALIAAGVLTFPVGTGLYYLCGKALRNSLELAAQSANIKPVFSIALGLVVLHEAVGGVTLVAVALIVVGAMVLVAGVKPERFSLSALGLGLTTAAAWALGEVLMKIAIVGPTSLSYTLSALVYGTAGFVAGMFIFAPRTMRQAFRLAGWRWVTPFLLHGLLSFGVGYSLYFESIRSAGLIPTVLVTAFWPGLALVVQQADGLMGGTRRRYAPAVWIGSLLLSVGALVQVLGTT